MVSVLSRNNKPLMPCTEKRARLLLNRGRARVHHAKPLVIRLVDRMIGDSFFQPIRIKLDPGSKETGVSVVRVDDISGEHVLMQIEIKHRGQQIRDALKQKSGFRRRRRSTNLRYREKRFDNRRRPEGWLPPSLQHRADNRTRCRTR